MLQGTSERLMRTAEHFQWSGDKLRIVRAVLDERHHPDTVAGAEGLSRRRVDNLVSEARNELYAKAVCECDEEALAVNVADEADPITKEDHAYALCRVLDFEEEYRDCLKAVAAVGAY